MSRIDKRMRYNKREKPTAGQPLWDLLPKLENYTPTIPDAVIINILQSSGCNTQDPRLVRLVSVAAQKLITDISNDALQHCKMRRNNKPSKSKKDGAESKEESYRLTTNDLNLAVEDLEIKIRPAPYYV